MSLARLALRLAAYEALNPYATMQTGPWPTIAGKNVFDSRVDLLQADDKPTVAAELEGKPILIVYTEEDVTGPYPGAKFPPEEQIVTLVIEAMIAVTGVLKVPQADGTFIEVGTIQAPITDRQHEAMLDTLEALVRRLLDPKTMAPSAALYTTVAIEIRQIESYPQRDGDRVTRNAARTVRFHVKVKPDRWRRVPVTPAPSGLDLLPEPLRSVANGLPAGSSGLALCQSLINAMQAPAPLLPLQSIGITTDLAGDPTGDDTVAALVVTDPGAPTQATPVNPASAPSSPSTP